MKLTITHLLEQLIDPNIDVDEKVRLISKLNTHIYDADVLFQIVQFFMARADLVTNPFNNTIDIVGTGGDGADTLNYSTLSALILNKFEIPVAKHGNKSVTSKCGSFDLLEHLNIEIPTTAIRASEILKEKKLVFLFAPYFHPVFKHIAEARKVFANKGEKTIFNCIGPLLNPASVKRTLIGVYDEQLIEPFAEVLKRCKVEYAYVVHGAGIDEFTICGVSKYAKIEQGNISYGSLQPEQAGLRRSTVEMLKAGDYYQNLEESNAIFAGELFGAKRDMLVLNSAAALQVAECFTQDISHYVNKVNELLDNGTCFFPEIK